MRTSPAPSSQATSTSAPASTSGWQSGRMSGVRLAAMMPAIRAAASASPFSSRPSLSSFSVWFEQRSSARATATREVRSFSPTSIIFMFGARLAVCASVGRVEIRRLRRLDASRDSLDWRLDPPKASARSPWLQPAISQLLVVFAVEVADLVHQRVAHLAVQLVVVVGGAGEVAPVEDDGAPGVGRGAIRRRAEEAQAPRRARPVAAPPASPP